MSKRPTPPSGRDPIVIVGTGFAGLAMAIRLKQSGIDDFIVLEQAGGVGGTWRDNHYPGAACDVQSHLYSFSFEPNPKWSRMYAPQKEILDYLEHCTDKYGIRPHIRFRCGVKGATFDEQSGTWSIETTSGETLHARVIVSGCGGLSRPSVPELPGLEEFQGKSFHTARWDHSFDFSGKRVAVIGTGASAIQVVPELAPKAASLRVFQRTAPWIMPKPDRMITPREQALFARFPFLQTLARLGIYWRNELFATGFIYETRILKLAEKLALKYLHKRVPNEALRQKLTPHYAMGCKRVLISNDYFEAVSRSNVDVVTAGIDRVTEKGIRTRDGVEHEFDAIVLATGFQAAEACAPFALRGRGGRDLNTEWRNGAEAFLGSTVTGFPNLFMIVGPNTGLGHTSMVFMIESQVQYALSAIETMRARDLKAVEVKRGAQSRYNERLHSRLGGTVWASGCNSWYQTSSGKNTTLWPGYTFEFRLRTRTFDPRDYEVEAKGATSDELPAPRDPLAHVAPATDVA